MTRTPPQARRLAGTTSPFSPPARRARTSVTDDAITRIRHMILAGQLGPGDKLPPESELAAGLGLSRTSLREAVRALTLLGVIDTRQGDASYITSLGPELLLNALGLAMDLQREDTMADLVGVRRILEPAATAMAASRMTAADVAHLRTLIRPELGEDQAREAVRLDWEFHHAIAKTSGNDLLVALLDGLSAPTIRMRTWRGLSVPGILQRTAGEHEAIVAALERGDPELARSAATVHVSGVEAWVRALPPGWSVQAAAEVRRQAVADHHPRPLTNTRPLPPDRAGSPA